MSDNDRPIAGQMGFFDMVLEQQAAEEAIDWHRRLRGHLISAARGVAIELAQKHGTVTMPEVFGQLHLRGLAQALSQVDPRWSGAVFKESETWQDITKSTTTRCGSHGRPVRVWRLRDDGWRPPR